MKKLSKFFSLNNLRKAMNCLLMISLLYIWVAFPLQMADEAARQLHGYS